MKATASIASATVARETDGHVRGGRMPAALAAATPAISARDVHWAWEKPPR